MGIPGLLKEIGKGERVALTKLALDHFAKHKRPLRIAIDAAIWNFQHQSAQGGKNPALRTLFYRLLKLLSLPIHPVFVYDGKNKPLTKRGKTVSRYGTCVPNELSKNLIARFQFPHHTAPGEAEAECAILQKNGFVDAVMSQDVDAIMFGSTVTFREWSKEGTKGNKSPTHVNVLESSQVKEITGLDPAGMILVALLSGGDYNDGVPGFGISLSCSIARAGFGQDLIDLVHQNDTDGLREWRERLQYELETNESGYFAKRHKTVRVPPDFPDRAVLNYYLDPVVSKKEDMKNLEARWTQWWNREIDIPALRTYVAMTFDWLYKGGAMKFIRSMAQPLFQQRLFRSQINANFLTVNALSERRKHFITGGVSELRLAVVPAAIVEVDLDAEEDNPEFADLEVDPAEEVDFPEASQKQTNEAAPAEPSSPTKRRQRPSWDPNFQEKWWIPEEILKLGLPSLIQEWEQRQADIRSNPGKTAARKTRRPDNVTSRPPKTIDSSMRPGAMTEFLAAIKPVSVSVLPEELRLNKDDVLISKRAPFQHVGSNLLGKPPAPRKDLADFFKPTKRVESAKLQPACIVITSSPVQETVTQHAVPAYLRSHLARAKTMPESVVGETRADESETELPINVTQRKRRAKDPSLTLVGHEDKVAQQGSDKLVRPLTWSSNINPSPTSILEANAGRSVTIGHNVFEGLLPVPEVSQRKSRKQFALSRDSLPGAWKEVAMTSSQSSKIAFLDLTNA